MLGLLLDRVTNGVKAGNAVLQGRLSGHRIKRSKLRLNVHFSKNFEEKMVKFDIKDIIFMS